MKISTIGAVLAAETRETSPVVCTSPTFTAAVAGSWFVRTVGLASIVCALFGGAGIFGLAILIALGLYIFRAKEVSYHRPLGLALIVSAFVGILIRAVPGLAVLVLALTILIHGIKILQVFSKEGHNAHQWAEGRNRAIVGVIAAAVGLLFWIITFSYGFYIASKVR